jgi:hypothetical protein
MLAGGVRLGEVAEVGGLRGAVVAGTGAVEDDDGADVLGVGDGELQREVSAEREADHREVAAGRTGAFAEERSCSPDVGSGTGGIEPVAQSFRVGDGVSELAVIEVRSEDDEAGLGEPRAEGAHRVVEPPPGVEDEHRAALSACGNGEVAVH